MLCKFVLHVQSLWEVYVTFEDTVLVHSVHSCTVNSIRERAFLILGELRHRNARGAAGTCPQQAAVQCIVAHTVSDYY